MRLRISEKTLHLLFDIGVVIKAVNGLLELMGGFLLLAVKQSTLRGFVMFVTNGELARDPHDILATALRHAASDFSVHLKIFIGIYLLLHGAIKLFLVINLLREKLWAFPFSLTILGFFVLYQTYRLLRLFSWPLLALTVFDLLVIFLVSHEYKMRKRQLAHRRALYAQKK